MPIEVRELVIKATVLSQGNSASEGGKVENKANNTVPPQEDAIKASLQKVLEVLKDRHER